jgi:hexosaminidase
MNDHARSSIHQDTPLLYSNLIQNTWLVRKLRHGHSMQAVYLLAFNGIGSLTDQSSEPPAGQLRLASPSTQNFTADLLSAAAKMFPSRMFSTGGDEVNTNCYDQDPETQVALNASGQTLEQALSFFTLKNQAALAVLGKTPIVKEGMLMLPKHRLCVFLYGSEILLDYNVSLSNATVVVYVLHPLLSFSDLTDHEARVWISSENATAVAARGYRLIHQPSDYFYLV